MGLSQLLIPPPQISQSDTEFGPFFFRLTALRHAGERHTQSSAASLCRFETPPACRRLTFLVLVFWLLFSVNLNRQTLS